MNVDGSERKSGILIARTKYKCMPLPSHFSSSFVFISAERKKNASDKTKGERKRKIVRKKGESSEKPFSAFDPNKNSIPSPAHSIIFALCLTHLPLVEKKKKFHIQQIIIILTSKMVRIKVFGVYIGEEANVWWETCMQNSCAMLAGVRFQWNAHPQQKRWWTMDVWRVGSERSKKNEQFNLILAAYYHRNNQSVWGLVAMKNLFFDWSFLFDTIIGCVCMHSALKRRSESESKIPIFDRKTNGKKGFRFILHSIE